MKASDYIVQFLISKGIDHVFGYPGGMVTHLMESLDQYSNKICAHLNYHEQASAMAACGYAEVTGRPGVAYATSGPGATNLLTGIACAYFESLPCLFITGQVNTYEAKGQLGVRQRGFQETDIVAMASPITKYSVAISNAEQLPEELEKAYSIAMDGRRGPVLIDIPMNVQRSEITKPYQKETEQRKLRDTEAAAQVILNALQNSAKPVLLVGHGVALADQKDALSIFAHKAGIPVVTSMIAVDILPTEDSLNFGFIGAYGARNANFMVNHCDLLITMGSRLDCRQTGVDKKLFAPKAKIVRIDTDLGEMTNKVSTEEKDIQADLQELLPLLAQVTPTRPEQFADWRTVCAELIKKIPAPKKEPGNLVAKQLGDLLGERVTITTDVGQNQVWVAQSLTVKKDQRILFSGGHGAMGYALPAAIGAAVANRRLTICFTGDGGLQMNLQEMQTVVREKLPIKIVLFNNSALGMIHHFQEMYFDSNYVQTDESKGYTNPNFEQIAAAYGIRYLDYNQTEKIQLTRYLQDDSPLFVEVQLPQNTYVFPKLGMNKPIHDQEPALERQLFHELEQLCNQAIPGRIRDEEQK
ncbi:thiamine pyrophosphate-binding protein [Pygmaiobacter massiliensis]|uniref:thiamine pyrophosphate-binding protein n=1 Tax=Pygmaiobacter massiliensis TaxID=1917873 RepID=UPI0028977BAA|nr:thiamine pyrophosphate-binding protein [Pygmaiobacter massiliensis]